MATTIYLDDESADIIKGDLVCRVSQSGTVAIVTKATAGALASYGFVWGIAVAGAEAGELARIKTSGRAHFSVTDLAEDGLVRVSSAARCEIVAAYVTGDYPVGVADSNGSVDLDPQIVTGGVLTAVDVAAPITSTGGATPVIGITAATTDLTYDDGAPSITAAVASGGLVQFAGKSLGALTNTAIAANGNLTVEVTKGGDGARVEGMLVIHCTYD